MSFLPSVAILGLAAAAALGLALARRSGDVLAEQRRAASRTLVLAIAMQSGHFAEEAATGFPERFGPLLGVPAMPSSFFLAFNLGWIAIWLLSIPGLRAGRTWAFFAAWFLAIAGMLNGLAHPLLAVAAGGYFPGLVTSPLVAAACAVLWLRLRAATESDSGG